MSNDLKSSDATERKDERPQADKFTDLARELGCDENEAAFKAAVRKIGTVPRPEKAKPESKE